ncbi:MAG: MFS transporter, partial [Candidatus Thermoplasmatota archaeon]|nr:MFS transporter [Candidatus Thermoplasmatota archaeon]
MEVYGLKGRTWLQVISAYAGWLMDGYTSIAYALVAVTISSVFFPSKVIGIYSLVATFGGLAVEELARPVGSVLLGNFLGDRLGRKNMLTITIVGFSIFAASKGLLPTFTQAGIFAPILLYIILFIEGLFAGAEYGGGTALSMESVPAKKRAP